MTSHVDSNSRNDERNRNSQGQIFAVVVVLLAVLVVMQAVLRVAVGVLGVAVVFVEMPCLFGWAVIVWFLPR